MIFKDKIFVPLRQKPLLRFLLTAIALYALWYGLYEAWLGPEGTLDHFVTGNSIYLASFVLTLSGYAAETGSTGIINTIGISGGQALWIGNPCNGISLFALFGGFVVAYPGPWAKKLWYIPAGVLLLHLMNVLRIAALCIIEYHRPDLLQFNHTYTFTFLMYLFVFALWMLWTSKAAAGRR